jgi:hypothetical protein
MKRLNWLFTLASLSVLLVTIERFSFTTKVLLQPGGFLRLHELFQMTVIILITIILPLFIVKEVTDNFQTLKIKKAFVLFLLFFIGIYFYSTGNGVHEISGFNFNNFCDTKNFSGDLCTGFFINDYYTGNILYFIGGFLMIIPVLLLEKLNPNKSWTKKDMKIALINAVIYSLAIFAYSGFDRVLVGLIYSGIVMIIADILWLKVRKKSLNFPLHTYTAATYTLGTLAALLVRLIR